MNIKELLNSDIKNVFSYDMDNFVEPNYYHLKFKNYSSDDQSAIFITKDLIHIYCYLTTSASIEPCLYNGECYIIKIIRNPIIGFGSDFGVMYFLEKVIYNTTRKELLIK